METEGTVNLEEGATFNVQSKTTPSYHLVVKINEQRVSMEIDTTVAVSIMSKVRFAGLPLAKPTLSLHTVYLHSREDGSFRGSFCTC